MFNLKRLLITVPLMLFCLFAVLACQAPDSASNGQEVTSYSSTQEAIQITVVDTPTPTSTPMPTPTPLPDTFLETFDGNPDEPTAWQPANWDVTVHSRDRETWDALEMMQASHGANCEPPPAKHTISAYEDAVFICGDHLMTAMMASGYGVIYFTPNYMVDFSENEAIIQFDLSTERTSPRDWVDLWITPYEDHLQLALDNVLPDLGGEPRRSIHIRMNYGYEDENSSGNKFLAQIINGFQVEELPLNDLTGYEQLLTPDAKRRNTFELRLSQNHIKFGLPEYNLWWIDAEIELDWQEGVVQFGHHSYNPLQECPTCTANTWHWDNVLISPANPFTIIRADRRFVDEEEERVINFPAPAPKNAHLRFAGIGNNLQISFDGGESWQVTELQSHIEEMRTAETFKSYWTPIPAGITQLHIRGQEWWGGGWHVRDISIWSPEVTR